MSGDTVASVKDAKTDDGGGPRERSKIAFPYNDLDSVIEMTEAIHNHVGTGTCDDSQLAAWTGLSQKSSGYRSQLAAARMFGLIESSSGQHKLAKLGRQIVDSVRERAARVDAFLNVPLFRAVFDNYKDGVMPPAAALERDLGGIGIADKAKQRARRVLERSADQAGFYSQGRDRLVMPGVKRGEETPPPDPLKNNGNGSGGGDDGFGELDMLIRGLIQKLPVSGSVWPSEDRKKWLALAEGIFGVVYNDKAKDIDISEPNQIE